MIKKVVWNNFKYIRTLFYRQFWLLNYLDIVFVCKSNLTYIIFNKYR